MSEGNLLLEASKIVMNFGGLKALNGVDVKVREKEILGLIGPNGSGKTTFFNVITGIYHLTSGSLNYKNRSIVRKTSQEIARLGIIRTFQSSRLWLDLSIMDNLLLGMWMRPKPGIFKTIFRYRDIKEDFSRKTEDVIKVLSIFSPGLANSLYKRVGELTLGDRRRVEICRAFLAEPKLLLLDEPSAGMDPSETQRLMNDIQKLKGECGNIGIIVIEHDMGVISQIAERVVVFNFGKKIAEGSFGEIRNNHEVKEAYLGKEFYDA